MAPNFLLNHPLTASQNPQPLLASARPTAGSVDSGKVVIDCPGDWHSEDDPGCLRLDGAHRPAPRPAAKHPLQSLQLGELRAFASHFAFVVQESLLENLDVVTKPEAIGAMVASLCRHGALPLALQEEIAATVLKRESLGSTGIGEGVAIPHSKYPGLPRVVATLAYSRSGIAFDSVDGERVHLICLLISPSERPADHLLALQAISRRLANRDYASWRSAKRHRGEND